MQTLQYEYAMVPVRRTVAQEQETYTPEPPASYRPRKLPNQFPMFKVECLECQKVFSTQTLKCKCPNCGGHDVKPQVGDTSA